MADPPPSASQQSSSSGQHQSTLPYTIKNLVTTVEYIYCLCDETKKTLPRKVALLSTLKIKRFYSARITGAFHYANIRLHFPSFVLDHLLNRGLTAVEINRHLTTII
jgi:hypothetical protein